VQLVKDDGMTVEAMLCVCLCADALVPAAFVFDLIAQHLGPSTQVLVVCNHLLCDVEYNIGLASVSCCTNDFRARLAISKQHV